MSKPGEAWYLNGRAYYGGGIAPGDTLEPYSYPVPCPHCGQAARREDYERVEGGSLNRYVRTQCRHCGYARDSGGL